jgi:hypothetical protein
METTYKILTNDLGEVTIERTRGEEICNIPKDLGNRDYQEYLESLNEAATL